MASTSNGEGKKLKKAEITLNDCLACSGCVTSAESVLVAMQSHEEVYKVLEEQPVSGTDPAIQVCTLRSSLPAYDLRFPITATSSISCQFCLSRPSPSLLLQRYTAYPPSRASDVCEDSSRRAWGSGELSVVGHPTFFRERSIVTSRD